MTSYSIEIDQLAYHLEIDGQGSPLVLLHGFTGSTQSWNVHIEALAARFQVIRIDLPGHGRTPAPSVDRCAFTRVAGDLALLIGRAADAPVHLLGYSMGGRLALQVALNDPDRIRSLILESASPGLENESERAARRTADEALAEQIVAQGVAAFVDTWEKLPLFASHARLAQSIRDEQRAQRLRNDPHGLATSLRALSTGAQPDLWPRLHELRPPTLLITGAEDRKFTALAQRMVLTIPDATHQVVSGAGHTPHLEQRDAFRSSVAAFLLT